jgi:hypothetical protein
MFLGTDGQRIVRFRQAKEGMGTPLQGFPNAQHNFTRRALMQGLKYGTRCATSRCGSMQV